MNNHVFAVPHEIDPLLIMSVMHNPKEHVLVIPAEPSLRNPVTKDICSMSDIMSSYVWVLLNSELLFSVSVQLVQVAQMLQVTLKMHFTDIVP